jgi:hypothetical protein
MPSICVVHLVRYRNGPKPFGKFIESLRDNPGGHPFDLLLIFKGFPSREITGDYGRLIRSLPHRRLFVPDIGFDIAPYFKAVREFDYEYFCFLNSYSTLLDPDWLSKMFRNILLPDVGIVGATGSWQSMYSGSFESEKRGYPLWKRIFAGPWRRVLRKFFAPFPNAHIRTNAFLVSRETMRKIRHGWILTKMDAWRFESGKTGLTKLIIDMKLKPLVVGRDGLAYEKEDWCRSGTFWQREQQNLLVADRQTLRYATADPGERRWMRRYAWGDETPK